jgi:hypothetical protein
MNGINKIMKIHGKVKREGEGERKKREVEGERGD